MNSIKCSKCGFMTFATALSCKNCNHRFEASNPINNLKTPNGSDSADKPISGAETFCAFNFVAVAIVTGVVFCLYWNSFVLSQFLPSGTYPLILLILFYLPAGILALVCGFAWFSVLRFVFKSLGFKFSD